MKLVPLKYTQHLSILDHFPFEIQVKHQILVKHPSFCIQKMCMQELSHYLPALMEQQQFLSHISSHDIDNYCMLESNQSKHSLVEQQFPSHISFRGITNYCKRELIQPEHILVEQRFLFHISFHDIDSYCKRELIQLEHILVELLFLFHISFHDIDSYCMLELILPVRIHRLVWLHIRLLEHSRMEYQQQIPFCIYMKCRMELIQLKQILQ